MEKFDKDQLRQSLAALEPWKRVAFMLLCCARMLPNYERFSAETGFGDAVKLKHAMQKAWSWLEPNSLPEELEGVRTEVESLTPDTEHFSSSLTSAALDAACSVAYALDAIDARSDVAMVDFAVEVATLARDTVDLYVQYAENFSISDPALSKAIDIHPLMQRELRHQRIDIAQLANWSGTRRDGIQTFKTTSLDTLRGSLDPIAVR